RDWSSDVCSSDLGSGTSGPSGVDVGPAAPSGGPVEGTAVGADEVVASSPVPATSPSGEAQAVTTSAAAPRRAITGDRPFMAVASCAVLAGRPDQATRAAPGGTGSDQDVARPSMAARLASYCRRPTRRHSSRTGAGRFFRSHWSPPPGWGGHDHPQQRERLALGPFRPVGQEA